MNGAITVPCVVTMRIPMKRIVIISGASQYFFRIFRKSQISFISSRNAFIVLKDFCKVNFYVGSYFSIRFF